LFRKSVSGILLFLLLVSTLTLAFKIRLVKAEGGTIYIRADGSIDPPTAPISTFDNVTYTLTGNIISDADGIVVERSNIIIDGAGYTLQGTKTGSHKGVNLDGRSNVTIKNTTITTFDNGIQLSGSSNNTISGNNITNNGEGIFLDSSSNNTLSGNNVTANNWDGIWLESSSNNNSISGNTFSNDGLFVHGSYENVVADNYVNGKPLVYLEGASDLVVDGAGQVILVDSVNITVEGLNLSSTSVGIELLRTNNTKIAGNNITNNEEGISLQHSSNNGIYHNNFINNTYQVASEDSVNVYDDDYPSGGNYWSDYTDVDLYYGPYRNQTGSDGIWDHPYVIDANNTDRYPLVNPWTPISSYVQGIDMSHYQGDVNWSMVYGAGYRFAFVKATGGVSFTDPNFTANIEQASEAGLIVGAYHFAYPEYNDAVSEALHFLSVAGNYVKTGYLRPVLDLEDDPKEDSYPYRMGKENLTNWIRTWMNTVKNETGIEPIIYTGWYARVGGYLNDSIAQYDLWIADWTYNPTISPDTGIWDSWDFWQYSNKGAIPGIAGDVDLDLFNGYMQRLYDAFTISNVKMFNVVWGNKTYPITVFSNSTVTHLVLNQTQAQISLNITGSHGSEGYCNITIPKDLVKGPWTYITDGETPSVIDISEEGENATHSFIYFTYIHASTFRITIQGAWVVPEFTSIISLPLLMLTTLIVTVLLKKKREAKLQLP
jgi:lysozyme